MSSPLTTIKHTSRHVQQALLNNCWYVYHLAATVEGEPATEAARVYQARTKQGRFQVRHLKTGQWHDVAPADLLFQQ
ncbi:hypothetical protein F1C16_21950 (plasmid) [Hymenobacter sp. NBH84]|uniref:hypothetical protein n=1 Tax=Hymenobacter sp. NBH84 TaxID=2596915 RepID=UPI00162A2EF1|nr:hypothetical protein [Hymenobacter sp. NBH84]QNE42291.1 hypothetical protein F1C16_21950 [Hymenobacter sp. NBH84]